MEERGATKEREIKKERNAVLYLFNLPRWYFTLGPQAKPLSISDMNPFHCAPKK
jgi:hypothetical protein